MNIELRKYYYSMNNVVDYDILDYLNFYEENEDNKFYVNVYLEVRVVSFENNKFISKYQKESFKLRQIDNGNSLKAGANVINCYNCGASIDVLKNKCEYCDSDVKYFQEWILDKK